jgi:predicted DCC family thiol-disulfide oxidoreductase YuxK
VRDLVGRVSRTVDPSAGSDPGVTREGVPSRGWVLYDGGCGVCARWVPFWEPTLARLGLAVAPLQAPWAAARLGLGPDALVGDLRLLLCDGQQLAGADVYRYVMRRLWWAYPFYLLAAAPGFRRLFERGYRAFADHRLAISRACRLPPPPRSPGP